MGTLIITSTCKAAHKRCELNETCKWHLSEVLMRCTIDGNCIRTQCAAALRRFSRYVSAQFSEAVTFCQCATADTECKQLQHMLYPRCMYAHPGEKPKDICTDAIEMCNADSYCNRRLPKFNQSCSVTEGGVCDAKDLQACRKTLLSIRGTPLEMPCFCTENDKDCIQNQSLMLPSNPCVESAMEDYAKHHVPPQQIQEPDNDLDIEQSWKNDVSATVEKPSTTKPSMITSSSTSTTTTTLSSEETSIESKAQKLLEQKKLKSAKTTQKELVQDRSKSAKKKESIQIEDKIVKNPNETLDFIPTTINPFKRKNLHTYPTDAYITHAPPPEGGCMARNIDGTWITHYKNSVIRQYYDWSGQCSSWCECTESEELNCHELPCLPDGSCQTLQTKIAFGEKLYIDGRGACICQSGDFICDTSEDMKTEELEPGLYITLGYSLQELKIFKEKVPKKYREKSGLVSPESSVVKDIVSRLQFALERVMPKEMLCRIVTLDDLSHGSTVMLQLQWYGVDFYTNDTESRWHIGRMEKVKI
uniref:GDNF/GAS1 domain-containing protein n=1 Tax=Panagrolaimus sp. ES5 TaxID=591445 RepID=A0AC34F127_9BILA